MATRVKETARQESLTAMRDEYATYFNLVETPPRMLVGKSVPSLDPDKDTEIIRDANDARDYQEAAKSLLAKELGSRVQANVAEQSTHLQVISQSVDMLQKNPDLLRDKQLADRVATLIKPYEYRKDGKLYGWSVNVVPLVDQVRQQLQSERAAGAAGKLPAPVAPAAPAAQPSSPPAPAPQQGLKSSAGMQAPQEGFDQLWSTLGFAPGTINL